MSEQLVSSELCASLRESLRRCIGVSGIGLNDPEVSNSVQFPSTLSPFLSLSLSVSLSLSPPRGASRSGRVERRRVWITDV